METRGLLFIVAVSVFQIPAHAAPVNTYAGMWWDPAKSGQGIGISEQGPALLVSWYTYGASGAATWLLLRGNLDASGKILTGPIYSYSGTQFGPNYNPATTSGTSVGTGTLNFSSDTNGTFTYTAFGITGTLNLARFDLGAFDISGKYETMEWVTITTCPNLPVGTLSTFSGNILQTGNVYSGSSAPSNNPSASCSATGSIIQQGSKLLLQANSSCTNGVTENSISEVTPSDTGYSGTNFVTITQPYTCTYTSTVAAIKTN